MPRKQAPPVAPKRKKTTPADGVQTPTKSPTGQVSGGSASSRSEKPFPVVGIGASAGGLDALTTMLKAMPDNVGMAFVVVQHMDPKRESLLDKLLTRATAMPVAQATQGVKVKPNCVYVIPPNSSLTIAKRRLRLEVRPSGIEGHALIDHFFQSLADDQTVNAIGVVLSGIGSDGTIGLKAIKAAGGITLAQDEKSAQYTGMPHSALAAGAVDLAASPSGIATELGNLASHPILRLAKNAENAQVPSGESMALRRIFELLEKSSGVDFTHYKPGTTDRRIRRRMVVRKCESLRQYLNYLESNPNEANALFEDIVIHVTSFFREKDSFEALAKEVFPRITADREENDAIRIWVPGCASGEEVYSIAICLLEHLGDRASRYRIQVFGTDISMSEIERARAGIYPESSMAELSPERLSRFFTKVNGSYQIARTVRDLCVFARHDLTKDPPFSRLDLISCRNVLIYLGPILHNRVMAAFHYALKPGGLLLLGKSESIGGYSTLFTGVGCPAKVYARKSLAVQPRLETRSMDFDRLDMPQRKAAEFPVSFNLRSEGERMVLDKFAPPGFFVDADHQIVHIQGDTSAFVKPSPGQPSFHLLKLVRSELVVELRKALHNASKNGEADQTGDIRIRDNGRNRTVQLEVIPVPVPQGNSSNFLVLFHSRGPRMRAKASKPDTEKNRGEQDMELDGLQRELASTQEYLQSIVEDSEASAEELRAANEEILSSNEEFQSTNEELETAKEELQSSNEELATLNEELENRNWELAVLASDLSSLLVGIEIPIVILGADHRIRRFTPSAEKVFNLIPSDVGRPIGNIKPNVELSDLEELAEKVLSEGRNLERDVQDRNGRWYSLRMRPHLTSNDDGTGVLIALADIDALKKSLNEATESRSIAEAEREQALTSLRNSESALRRSQGQLRSLAGRLLAGREDQNRRLTKQLRENFSQRLAAIGFELSAFRDTARGSDKGILHRLQDQLSTISDEISQMAQRLHPSGVELLGLASTIRDTCQHFSRQEGVPVKFIQRNVPKEIAPELGMCFYRVLQESLDNIAQHAEATKAFVTLSAAGGILRLSIKDNGAGFDPTQVEGGLGLITMEERVRSANGKVTLRSQKGKGTELIVEAPLDDSTA